MSLAVSLTVTAQNVTNVNTAVSYATMQAAIDEAAAGDTPVPIVHTLNEAVTINKSLKNAGAGSGRVIINSSGIGVSMTGNDNSVFTPYFCLCETRQKVQR